MRKLLHIVCILSGLMAFAACVKQAEKPLMAPSPKLSAIDSLIWEQPDIALACLIPYFDTCCRDAKFCVSTSTEYDRHYAHLLLSELLYKNYYDQTNRTELLDAVAYFDSLMVLADTRGVSLQGTRRRDARRASAQNTAFLDARAHYTNGVGYYEHDSVVPACKEYLTALEVMEEHFKEEELVGKKAQFMAYTLTRLTDLFSDLYGHEQAICFARRSLSYYQKQDAPSWYSARMLCEIGTQYDNMEELDSAYYYYNRAAIVLDDTTSLMYRDIVTRQAFLSYRRTHRPEKELSTMYRLASMAENKDELMARYLVIGNIYYYEKQFDSAYAYMKTVYDNMEYRDSRMLSAERLQEMAFDQGDTLLAKEYALTRSSLASLPDQEGNMHASLTALILQYEQNKQAKQHSLQSKRVLFFWIKLFVIVALVVIVLVLLLAKQNKSRVTERQEHKMQQAALSGRLKKSHRELRELKSQIKRQASSVSNIPAVSFLEEPVCKMIMKRVDEGQFKSQMDCCVYKDYALSKEQIIELRSAANRHFNHFTERLAQDYPDLTNSDLDYCCLYLLDLSDADIAALMQRAYSTVSDRSRKLKAVFENNDLLSITLRRIADKKATD